MRWISALLLALLLAGCTTPGAAPPAQDAGESPPSSRPVEEPAPAPSESAPAPSEPPPKSAEPSEPEGKAPLCREGVPVTRWAEPEPAASPVQARAFVKGDPHLASPVVAELTALPVTLVVQFSEPVAPGTFTLGVTDACGSAEGIEQTVTWLSDRQAEIRLTAAPPMGTFRIGFGDGKDRQGDEVGAPPFWFVRSEGRPLRVMSQPVTGGEPEVLWEGRTALSLVSVSPDGRYLLLRRPVNFLMHPQLTVIPYVLDLQTGRMRSFSRGRLDGVRWDLEQGALWLNGRRRVSLDGTEETGEELAAAIPGGSDRLLAAAVSPDGRYLAALKWTDPQAGMYGVADLLLIDLPTGAVRPLPEAVGYMAEQPDWMRMQWAPDSRSLLLPSYDEHGVPRFIRLDPADLSRATLPVAVRTYSYIRFSPGGRFVEVGKAGIFTPDGAAVYPDEELWGGIWSANDRYVFLPGRGQVLEVETGRLVDVVLPSQSHVIGLSADGAHIFYTDS